MVMAEPDWPWNVRLSVRQCGPDVVIVTGTLVTGVQFTVSAAAGAATNSPRARAANGGKA